MYRSHRRLTLFLTIALLAVAPLTSSATSAPTLPATAEWTVLVYMNADNNLEPDAFINFTQMAAIGSSDAVNILVQFDRIAKYRHTRPEWSQTLRFRVTRGMAPTPANAVEDIGEANMGAGQTLADFVSWGRSRYPARRYMLVIWDHGQGWRLFTESLLSRHRELQRARSLSTTDAVASLRSASTLLRTGQGRADTAGTTAPFRSAPGDAYRSASNDETDGDVLYNRETADALKASLGGAHLDVIGFDACLMSMVESAYAFRDVADVLVGSEELEPGLGWKYDTWLGPLVTTPTQTARDLSKTVVESYRQTYGGASGEPETTLSAIDLARIPALASEISRFSQTVMDRIDSELQSLVAARAAISTYAPGYEFYHVDLKQFADEVARRSSGADVVKAARRVGEAIDQAVIANYAGPERQGNYGSHGLAIYFPDSESQHLHDPYAEGGYERGNTLFPLEFVEREKWTDFLHAFWARVP